MEATQVELEQVAFMIDGYICNQANKTPEQRFKIAKTELLEQHERKGRMIAAMTFEKFHQHKR